jgi:general secretion pathway protein G
MVTIETLRRAAHRSASRGLTLVELIVVITIIGVLTAAISVGVMSAKKSADLKLAKTACNTIRDATI